MLRDGAGSGLSASFHFDSHKLADYLRHIAVSRGVVHQQARVEALVCDEQRMARSLELDDGQSVRVDLLVDASGLALRGRPAVTRWSSGGSWPLGGGGARRLDGQGKMVGCRNERPPRHAATGS